MQPGGNLTSYIDFGAFSVGGTENNQSHPLALFEATFGGKHFITTMSHLLFSSS